MLVPEEALCQGQLFSAVQRTTRPRTEPGAGAGVRTYTHTCTHTHTLAHTQTHTQTHTGGQGIAVDWDIAEAWYRKFFAERSDWSKQLEKADAALEDGGCF
jgi:hypothetical protein